MVKLTCDGTRRTLTFPGDWNWIGEGLPETIPANMDGVLMLWSWGTVNATVWAQWIPEQSISQYETLAISTTGTSTLTFEDFFSVYSVLATVTDGYGSAFTHKVVLPALNADSGDRCHIYFDMPADGDPTIEVRDLTDGGTILLSFTSHPIALPLKAEFVFDGTNWKLFSYSYVGDSVVKTTYGRETVTYAANVTIDFDGLPYQEISLTGDIDFATTNRAGAGEMKSVTVKCLCDATSRNITFNASIKGTGSGLPASVSASKSVFITFTSWGSAETDTYVASVEES